MDDKRLGTSFLPSAYWKNLGIPISNVGEEEVVTRRRNSRLNCQARAVAYEDWGGTTVKLGVSD